MGSGTILRRGRIGAALLALTVALLLGASAAAAAVPYQTYTLDQRGRLIHLQPAYYPDGLLGGDAGLSKPQDLFVAPGGDMYVADTGNNRIVRLDAAGRTQQVYDVPDSPLSQPSGVFVAEDGRIYVADTGNRRIVVLNAAGKLVAQFGRPDSRLLPASYVFEPTHLAVDRRGFLFVATRGGYQGLLELDPEGRFHGFFGANRVQVSLMELVRRAIYTEEQLQRREKLLPVSIQNLALDAQGFVYTVSHDGGSEQVKKLNIRGDNQWGGRSFGEVPADSGGTDGTGGADKADGAGANLVDLTVDHGGNVTVIDRNRHVVSQYDTSGKLLFYWFGAADVGNPRFGVVQSPSAIASGPDDELLILDDQLGLIQRLKPTAFGRSIYEAIALGKSGSYDESERAWQNVLQMNAHFTPAYEGLAKSSLQKEQYGQAADYAKLAGSAALYSDAFWQIRLQWFQANFALIANIVILLAILAVALPPVRRRLKGRLPISSGWRARLEGWRRRGHAFYLLRHPIDGFTALRYEGKGSYVAALGLLVVTCVSLALRSYYTGFAFHPVGRGETELGSVLAPFLCIWLSWVVCQYLIGSINRGEARFKDIFVGSAYAMLPVTVAGVPIILLSNALTLSEHAIFGFLTTAMIVWTVLLFYWKVQSLQNYSVGETLLSILLTVLAMLLLWTLLFIVFGLTSEYLQFLYAIYREVTM